MTLLKNWDNYTITKALIKTMLPIAPHPLKKKQTKKKNENIILKHLLNICFELINA